jgi:hypothetical protein
MRWVSIGGTNKAASYEGFIGPPALAVVTSAGNPAHLT